jgi:hypothetical protein
MGKTDKVVNIAAVIRVDLIFNIRTPVGEGKILSKPYQSDIYY